MKKAPLIARLILGFIFFFFGLNGFFHFLSMPPLSEEVQKFFSGLMVTRYFLPFLSGVQVLCGLLLLIGIFVPLALVVLAPVVTHIFLFHIFLDPKGLPLAIVVGLLELYLAFFAAPYSEIVKKIFRRPQKEALAA